MWYVGLDVHAETTTVSVRSARGIIVRREVVATNAASLRRVLAGTRGRVRIACEVGPLAAWIKRSLQTQLREVVICDRRRTRLTVRGGPKADKFDADRLSECLRLGTVHPVYIPEGGELQLRQLANHYVRMMRERARAIQRLRALFLESGVRIGGRGDSRQRPPIRRLSGAAAKAVARAYIRQIKATTELVDEARGLFIHAAEQCSAYETLQSIPFIGKMRAAMLIATVGNPARFTSRRKFWAYGGLAVVRNISSEHRIEDGRIVRVEKSQGARLNKSAQPALKKLLRDIALHASVRRGPFRELYDSHIAQGRSPAIARLTLARKIATIVLAVWRSGDPFDPSLLRTQKNSFGASIERAPEPPPSNVVKATALTICRPEEHHSNRSKPGTG